ncbi:MAG: lysophospholipid acyltransferase family protein [Prevotella sp.]|nr:lysophospholipid acyltransferase family protein [Prevotella sp.]
MKLLYPVIYALWCALSLLPLRLLYVFSDAVSWLMFRVIKYRHKTILKNLSSSFPEKNEREIRLLERNFYRYLCDYFVETVKLMTMSERQLCRRMTFTGMEELNRVLDKGQSCAIYLGHYGNWEWIVSLPLWTSDHVQCGQIYHPLENASFDRLFLKVRERFGARCIPMKDTLRSILQYRQQKKVVCIGYISDQAPHWSNIHHWIDFLHHDTPVLTGAERIVKSVDHAVFYGDVTRPRRGYYNCEMRLISEHPKGQSDWNITDIYFKELENTILRAPELYLWSHKRWKRTREEFNRRYTYRDGKVIKRSEELIVTTK